MSSRGAKKKKLPAWTPFEPAIVSPKQVESRRKVLGDALADNMLKQQEEIWLNSRFQVHIYRNAPNGFHQPVAWLSIKTRQAPFHRHDWRELQRIKNELCGEECEAVEIYPAESRLHDSADQYHLWVFPKGERIPLGFADRIVGDAHPGGTGSQRKFETRPDDADEVERHGFVKWQWEGKP